VNFIWVDRFSGKFSGLLGFKTNDQNLLRKIENSQKLLADGRNNTKTKKTFYVIGELNTGSQNLAPKNLFTQFILKLKLVEKYSLTTS
jgi:hypothetical protein